MKIFINYRSRDEPYVPVLLERALRDRFGADNVFRDSTGIPLGEDFRGVLWGQLAAADVLLAVMGPAWLASLNDDPNDYVRAEIEFALTQRKRVIPILVGGISMPSLQELPRELSDLRYRQYARVDHRTAERDIEDIVLRLDDPPTGSYERSSGTPEPPGSGASSAQHVDHDEQPQIGIQVSGGTINARNIAGRDVHDSGHGQP